MNFFDVFQLAVLAFFLLVFLGRGLILWFKQGINPFAVGAGKKGLPRLFELFLLPWLVLWVLEILFSALHSSFELIPASWNPLLVDSFLLKIIGALLILFGNFVFVWALISFGNSWRVGIDEKKAVSDVTGVTGQAIIRAIVAGVRDSQELASLREPGCKKDEAEIAKALTGTWRDEHLFVLKQALALYDFYSQQILKCDEEIERKYTETRPDWDAGELPALPARKRNSHSKNRYHESEKIRGHLKRISGVDISLVDGFGVSLAQTVILECGTDMLKFPTEKHFGSWLGLAPKHEISGGKILNNKTLKTKNRTGQAFRMAAQTVKQADCPFGVFYRRLRARLGPAQATVATAHAIARVVYRMLKYKVEYDPLSVNEYQKQYEEQQIKYMKKRAAKLGFALVQVEA